MLVTSGRVLGSCACCDVDHCIGGVISGQGDVLFWGLVPVELFVSFSGLLNW